MMQSENRTNTQATRGKFIMSFISGMIAMAIILTTVSMMRSSYQGSPQEISQEATATRGFCYFDEIAERIGKLDERNRTDASISLHSLYSWDEPVEGSHWSAGANYCVSLPLPESFMEYGHEIVISVDYPDCIAAGETGVISITAKDENGDVRTGEYSFTATTDLYLAHGEYSEFHEAVIGDAIDISDYLNAIVIEFSTFADQYNGERPDDLSARTGACPTTVVLFNRHPNLDTNF